MQTRNYMLFLVLSMGILIGWETFVVPRMFPRKPVAKKDVKQPENPPKADDKAKKAEARPKVAAHDAPKGAAKKTDEKPSVAAAKEPASTAKQPAAGAKAQPLPTFEHKSVKIGSLDPATGYFLEAELDSKGASLASLKLNDPRYRELKDSKIPLNLVGNDYDQRFLNLLQDRDTAQSERNSAAALVSKEVEARRPV